MFVHLIAVVDPSVALDMRYLEAWPYYRDMASACGMPQALGDVEKWTSHLHEVFHTACGV